MMSRLSKYHPSVYFDRMDKHDNKTYLNYYNNKSMKTKLDIKILHKAFEDVDVLF